MMTTRELSRSFENHAIRSKTKLRKNNGLVGEITIASQGSSFHQGIRTKLYIIAQRNFKGDFQLRINDSQQRVCKPVFSPESEADIQFERKARGFSFLSRVKLEI